MARQGWFSRVTVGTEDLRGFSKVIVGVLVSLLVAPLSAFAASEVCAECHAEIYRTYARTPMAMSAGRAGAGSLLPLLLKSSFTDRQSNFAYTAGRDSLGYFFTFRNFNGAGDTAVKRQLPYFIGSGTAAQAFAMSVDGFLYEAPVTWYRRTNAWGLSPGYEKYSYPFLTRTVVPRCLDCHASGVQPIDGTQNGYASPPFLEGGVACERCHGPGDAHILRMRAKTAGAPAIVNPAALDAERRDSVCAQCHLTGEVIVEKPGQEHRRFIVGEKLQDHSVAFVRASASTQTRVTSHVEDLAQSKCKRISGNAMWCGTCHDPHSVPLPAVKAKWFREKCLTCHTVVDCRASQVARKASGDSCVSCHMPRNTVADAEHVVYTDHSIPRLARLRSIEKQPLDAPLVPFGNAAVSARELGLAYAMVAIREQNMPYGERALALLKQSLLIDPADPQTLSYLADLYKKRSDDKTAIELYRRLLLGDPFDTTAPVALGGYAMERGNYSEAIGLWSGALKKNPALLLVRANLAIALIRMGRSTEARTVLNDALKFNPGFSTARDLLKKIGPQ